eukprot:2317812-Pleurochrysis_carterae.AAC.1
MSCSLCALTRTRRVSPRSSLRAEPSLPFELPLCAVHSSSHTLSCESYTPMRGRAEDHSMLDLENVRLSL